ncbi:hypothetical protein EOD40_16975 [Flavobacterium sufflavum]|uniref:Uncharacterized protein n=1 Tax=Flavobacterium sufflavum TaxID=1921138 RepID=A0A437KKC7_9FLAO|nr:hypothetical protein EOD40_16975 [Flavobacterium sufflavum]
MFSENRKRIFINEKGLGFFFFFLSVFDFFCFHGLNFFFFFLFFQMFKPTTIFSNIFSEIG